MKISYLTDLVVNLQLCERNLQKHFPPTHGNFGPNAMEALSKIGPVQILRCAVTIKSVTKKWEDKILLIIVMKNQQ